MSHSRMIFLLALCASGWVADARAQVDGPVLPPPTRPVVPGQQATPAGTSENITVTGKRFQAAPVPAPITAPGSSGVAGPEAARGFQPSIKPRSYCQSAYQNDVSGQPGNSQTQDGKCD